MNQQAPPARPTHFELARIRAKLEADNANELCLQDYRLLLAEIDYLKHLWPNNEGSMDFWKFAGQVEALRCSMLFDPDADASHESIAGYHYCIAMSHLSAAEFSLRIAAESGKQK